MSRYLLDTDSLSLLQRGHAVLRQNIVARGIDDVLLCSITLWEQFQGWQKAISSASTHAELEKAHRLVTDRLLPSWKLFPIVPFTQPAIARFELLEALRLNVGKNDLRIAAIALENSLTVVTRNLRDFRRVAGLTVEDWSV